MKRSGALKRSPLARTSRTAKPVRLRKPTVRELDKLCREATFRRDGNKCCVQGCTRDTIQWCHVRSRRYHSTRWRMENVLTLCAGHHLWWHHEPLEASLWFLAMYPDRNRMLIRARATVQKPDYHAIKLYLESL